MPSRSAAGQCAAFLGAAYGYGLVLGLVPALPFLIFGERPNLDWWQWLLLPLAFGLFGLASGALQNRFGALARGPNGDRWRLLALISIITLLLAVSAFILYASRYL